MFHCLKEISVWGEEKNKSQKWILKYDETASEVMEWMMRELFLKIIDLKYFLFSNIPLYMLCWINISSIWLKTISSSGRTTHHYQDMIRKHYKLYFIEFHHSPELTPGHFQDWIYMSWIMEIFYIQPIPSYMSFSKNIIFFLLVLPRKLFEPLTTKKRIYSYQEMHKQRE